MLAIIKKEMRGYFNSWIGYIFLFILVGLVGIFFTLINLYYGSGNFQDALSNIPIFCLILIPVLTMRLFAEEARQKTDQLLYTSPVSVLGIVLAKFFSAFILSFAALLITIIYPLMISSFGTLPASEIFTAYLGYALLMASFISVGMFVSACTENQIIAAVITFFVMLFMYIMDGIASFINSNITASSTGSAAGLNSLIFIIIVMGVFLYLIYDSTKNFYFTGLFGLVLLAIIVGLFVYDTSIFDGLLVKTVNWFSVMARFSSFGSGILNIADIVYYITFAGAFIYLTVNAIEKRRWK
ncbi:MAG: ABC transporter permease [Clostridiales bacterium]|jgi:ABC-2 type transport system permease protein|nr:ABC transporter permease [Clostridiales bacterium]